jgi:hypothetical protein
MDCTQAVSLQCHPDVTCTSVSRVRSLIRLDAANTLSATYTVEGAIEQLLIHGENLANAELWRRTCFELFVGATNDAEYYEFNFCPGGEWAIYGFRNYREGGLIHVDGLEPNIAVRRGADFLELSAAVPLDRLDGVSSGVSLTLGLSAVIEDRQGGLSYWALKHPAGEPDFHHPDNFAVEIQLPLGESGAIEYTAKP